MPNRIPIEAAKAVAVKHGCQQVILVAWDGKSTHVVTYGTTTEACDQAAMGGNLVKKALNWPESMCNAEPSRVTALKKRIKHLEDELERASR